MATQSAAAVRVPKASQLIASRLRRRIVTGELRTGDLLPTDRQMMEEFSVSRPTMRETYRILEHEGLIAVRRGAHGGAEVLEPSTEVVARAAGLVLQHRGTTLADVLAARVDLEAPAARLLAQRTDRAAVAELLAERHASLLPVDPYRFHEFNAYVVELTESQTLLLLTSMLRHVIEAASARFAGIPRPLAASERMRRRTTRTREQLIDLIRQGDASGAEALWRKHLTEARQILIEGVDESVVDLLT